MTLTGSLTVARMRGLQPRLPTTDKLGRFKETRQDPRKKEEEVSLIPGKTWQMAGFHLARRPGLSYKKVECCAVKSEHIRFQGASPKISDSEFLNF